jgi:hypothetical protein
MNDRLEELMDAIDLQDVFATAKYLDKLGFVVKDIDLDTLRLISQEVFELVKGKGLH